MQPKSRDESQDQQCYQSLSGTHSVTSFLPIFSTRKCVDSHNCTDQEHISGVKRRVGEIKKNFKRPESTNMDAEGTESDTSLQQLMSAFNHRIAELQLLMLARGLQARDYATDLGAIDVVVRSLEHQLLDIKNHLKDEAEAISKARELNELSYQQQKKIQQIFSKLPSQLPGSDISSAPELQETPTVSSISTEKQVTKEKKGRGAPPVCYISTEELASLSSYMKGRLTLDKVNAAVDEMVTFAEANARLLSQRKKVGDDLMKRVLELRELAYSDALKGKHFFLESDMRGQVLKLDHTGKAIITVLRHLGRISEVRVGRHRVFSILKV